MHFAIYKGEKSSAELVARLFQISGPDSAKAAQQAADLLLQSNPQLKDLNSVPAGTRLIVPETPFSVNQKELATPTSVVPVAPPEGARRGLQNLPDSLATS